MKDQKRAEQDRAAEELRRSEALFCNLADIDPAMLWVTEPDGSCSFLSRGWYGFTGQTEQEAFGQGGFGWLDAVHPDDRELAGRMFLEANEKHRPFSLDYRLRRHDGEYRWAIDEGRPRFGPNSEFLGYIGSVLDITERKQAEQAQTLLVEDLTRSHQYFRALFNWTPSAVGISTVAEGRLCDVNEGFIRLTGYTREELLGRTTLELGLWADPSQREIVLREIREQGFVHNREGQLRTKSGEIRSLMVTVDSIQLGSTPCLIYLGHDITERKRAEEALRESEEKYRTVFNSIDEGFCIVEMLFDQHGKPRDYLFLEINPMFEQLTGLSNAAGRTARELVPGLEEFWIETYGRVALTGESARFERYVEPMNRWFNIHASRVGDETSRRVAIVFTNITERKDSENALRRSEDRYRVATRATRDVVWDWDMVKDEVVWGEAMHTVFGHPPEHAGAVIRDAFEWWTAHIHPEDRERVGQSFERAADLGCEQWHEEYRFLRADGAYAEIEDAAFIVYNAENKPIRITGAMSDITERKQSEALLASEKKVLELIATGSALPDVLDTLMRETEAQSTDGMLCSVLLTDETGQRLLHGAAPSLPEAYNAVTHGLVIGPSAGSCGTAAFERKPVFVTDIAADPLWAVAKDVAAAHGLGACHSTPILSSQGRLLGTIAMYYRRPHNPGAHDRHLIERATQLAGIVIERKQGEEALRASEERFGSIVRSTNDGIVTLNRLGLITFWNPGAEQLFGYAPDEVLGKPMTLLMPERFRDRHERGIERASAAGHLTAAGRMFELAGIRKDGTEFPLELSLSSWSTRNGVFFTGIIRDITKRKQAEERLRQRDELITLMLNTGPGCIKRVAADGTVLSMNSTGLRLIDAGNEQEALGLCVFDLVAREHRDAFIAMHRAVLAGQSRNLEFETLSLRGTRRWMQTYAVPLRNPITGSTEQLSVTHDVTERKQREEALRLAKFSMDRAADAVYWIDPQAKVLDVNEAATRMLGYSKDELCAMTVHDLNPDFQADMWPGFWAETRNRRPMMIESFHKAKNGRLIPIEVSVNFLAYEGKEYHCAFVRDITERKRVEAALEASKARFRAIFDQTFQFIGLMKTDGTLIEANRSALQFAGIREEDVLGKLFWDTPWWTHSPDLQNRLREAVRQAASGNMVRFEATHPSATGELAYVDFSLKPVRDEHGNVTLLIPEGHNITERKRHEEALRESELRFSRIVGQTSVGVVQADPVGRMTLANPSWCQMLGYSEAELLQMNIADVTDPASLPSTQEAVRRLAEGGPDFQIEKNYRRKDGSVFMARSSISALRRPDGDYFGLIAVVLDITDRIRAETAMRESEDRYRSIFEKAVDGIFQTTPDGTYVAVNPALARIYGYDSPNDLIATITDIAGQLYVDPGHRDEFLRLMQAEGKVTGFESLVYRKDGSFIWISESARMLRDQAGTVVGYEGTVEDITERKRAEGRLRVTLDQVRTLSGRLATVQEEERARIARELHDELGVQLTCLKIDLSRVTSIVGNRAGPDIRANLNDRVGSMIEQVNSTIAAVQRLVTQLRPALLDNLGLVAAIEWQSRDFQKRTGISCTCVATADDIAMEPERATAVFRICQEALTNTARHAQATAVMIQLFSQPDSLQVMVTDNGVGIPDTKASDRRSLGLIGMQERAAQCGGTLKIEGDPDKGTTVTLYVPIGSWT